MAELRTEQDLLDERKKKERSFGEILRTKALPYIGIFVLLLVWEVAVRILELPSYLLPPPTEIVTVFIENIQRIGEHSWITA